MTNIKFIGFLYNYHSYSKVNYNLLKHSKNNYFLEITNIFQNNLTFHENKLNFEEYENQDDDLIFVSSFPYNMKHLDYSKPVLVFITNEYTSILKQFFDMTVNEMVNQKNLFFITPSKKSYDTFINESKDFKNKVYILPHGVDLINTKQSKSAKPNSFLHVSACSSNKNVPQIIKVFKELKRDVPDATLTIKTNKEMYNIPDFDLDENINIITESYSDAEMSELYNRHDTYISAGIYEAFDIPIVEAASHYLQVIINYKSPQNKLIPKTNQFKNDKELLQKMKLACKKKLERIVLPNTYLNDNIAQKFDEIILNVINKSKNERK